MAVVFNKIKVQKQNIIFIHHFLGGNPPFVLMPGVGFMVRAAGLASSGPEFAAELTPGGVDPACHPSEVGKMSTSILVEGHSISGTAMLPRNDSYSSAKLPHARTEQIL